MKTKGLTLTIIFEAQSLNYDEGFGNLSVLKKFHRGNGEAFTFSSRQSLRYSIFLQGLREFGWKPSDVSVEGSGTQKVTQLKSTIIESEESDLFGYMRTNVRIDNDGNKEITLLRTAPVKILPAISLEPFKSDIEMLTNKYQADKIREQPNIANIENHKSFYRYTISIDLHRIGTEKDEIGTRIGGKVNSEDNDYKKFNEELRELSLNPKDKSIRIRSFLSVVQNLYRDIRGRRENLKPIFIIGGVYDSCNPFFENLVNIEWIKGKPKIIIEPIKEILCSKYSYLNDNKKLSEKNLSEETFIGIRKGYFMNADNDFNLKSENEKDKSDKENNCKEILKGSPEFVIESLKTKVEEYYEPEKSTKN